MKLLGLGIKGYFLDPFNILDCSILIATSIDIIISNSSERNDKNFVVAIRAFRNISIFKLARTWKRLHLILKTIWRTLVEISAFTVFLFLFMFIYTILGMELFANYAKFNANN
jgi:hypothetical protein